MPKQLTNCATSEILNTAVLVSVSHAKGEIWTNIGDLHGDLADALASSHIRAEKTNVTP